MALENKKLSTYADLASANIDTTTKIVVLTGATKVNNNLPVTNFIEDSLTSTSVVKPLSAKQGKALQDTKAPIANPTFTGTVGGVTKAMVGLNNVDNTSDANKPISTAQAAGLAPKANPVFTGTIKTPSISLGVSGSETLVTADAFQLNVIGQCIHPTFGLTKYASAELALAALGGGYLYINTDNSISITES